MKYTVSIEIALPREKVAQRLADPTQLPKWLRGLVLHEPLSGTHGQVSTTSRVVMQIRQQKIECTETVTRREPADLRTIPSGSVVLFDREIVGKGMWSAARDRLIDCLPERGRFDSMPLAVDDPDLPAKAPHACRRIRLNSLPSSRAMGGPDAAEPEPD